MSVVSGWPGLTALRLICQEGNQGDCLFLITLLIDIKQKGCRLVACN